MEIVLEPQVALDLETMTVQTNGLEFSGLAFARIEGNDLIVYDYTVLDVGSSTLTEIAPDQILPLMNREDRDNLRVWFHRHPVGNGVPGPHNWSGTDNSTIENMPLGGIPELVGWSASIVRTPKGWVGRIDNHKAKTTVHVPVKGQADRNVFETIEALVPRKSFPKLISSSQTNWMFDRTPVAYGPIPELSGDIEWEPEFDYRNYPSEHAYLSDLSDYYGAFVNEFDIDIDGTVYLENLAVGQVASRRKRKKFFGVF